MCHSSLCAAVPPRPSSRCCEESNDIAILDSQFALMRMELLQLVDVHVKEASRPLHEEVAMLKLLLARIGVPLELTESCTFVGLGLVSAKALFPFDSIEQKSSVVEEEHPYRSPCSRCGLMCRLLLRERALMRSWVRCCRSHQSCMRCVRDFVWCFHWSRDHLRPSGVHSALAPTVARLYEQWRSVGA
jgi:hypothetical protein